MRKQRSAAEEADLARDALKSLDPGMNRESWLLIAGAARRAGVSFDDWHEWSKGGQNYGGLKDCRDAWAHFDTAGPATPASLFAMARDSGWRPPKQSSWESRPASRKGASPRSTKAGAKPAVTPEDIAAEEQKIAARRLRRDALWSAAAPADPLHPYLMRKQMDAANLRQLDVSEVVRILGYLPEAKEEPLQGVCLIVPLRLVDGSLASLELIDAQGRKCGLALPRKATFWTADPTALDPMVRQIGVAEGIATAASVETAAGHPVVAAGSYQNMAAVASALADAYPNSEIVIYPDRGKEQEAKAKAIAKEVLGRSIPLPNRYPEGWDYNDAIEADGVQALRDWVSPALSAPGVRVGFSFAKLRGQIEIEELLPGLPRGTLGLLVGQGAVGKTMLSLEVAAGLALGRDLTGSAQHFLAPATGKALQICLVLGEDAHVQIHNRLVSMIEAFRLSDADIQLLESNLRILALDGYDLRLVALGRDRRAEEGPFLPTLERQARWADLVVLDPLVRLHDSDENDNTAASALMLTLSQTSKDGDCATIILHHVPKASSGGKGDWRAARGAAAYSTSSRWQVLISPAEGPDGLPMGDAVHVQLVKHNYCAPRPAFGLRRSDGGVLLYDPIVQPPSSSAFDFMAAPPQKPRAPSSGFEYESPPYVDD